MEDEQDDVVPSLRFSLALLVHEVLVLVQIELPYGLFVEEAHVPRSPDVDDKNYDLDHQVGNVHHLGDKLVGKDVL